MNPLIIWATLIILSLFCMFYVIIDVLMGKGSTKRSSTSKAWWIVFAVLISIPTAIAYTITR